MASPRAAFAAGAAAAAAAAAVLYRPVLDFALLGDSYQWWQLAHAATHRWGLLLADLDTFYRPLSTWTLVVDRLLWGRDPAGFHATNLVFLAAAGVLLMGAGRRLGLGRAAAWLAGCVWMLSPFVDEPAIVVAIRFQYLLLAAWLVLVIVWPRQGEPWTRARTAAAVAAIAAAMLAKETWVVTPGLVLVLELARSRRRLRRALAPALVCAAAVAAYMAVYFLLLPSGKDYFHLGHEAVAKVPHMLSVFLQLEGLRPIAMTLDWKGITALFVTAVLVADGWRRRRPAAMVGSALLLLPVVPTLLVRYLPVRYLVAPYAGFLLVVAAAVAPRIGALAGRARAAAAGAAGALAALVLTAGVFTVRADLADYGRVSDAHRRLLGEARRALPAVPTDRPVLAVRLEQTYPLLAIATTPRGQAKLHFPRHDDPYALIDTAALFEWASDREELAFERVGDWRSRMAGQPGAVLLHRDGDFELLSRKVDNLAAVARSFERQGARVSVIRAVGLAGADGPR